MMMNYIHLYFTCQLNVEYKSVHMDKLKNNITTATVNHWLCSVCLD